VIPFALFVLGFVFPESPFEVFNLPCQIPLAIGDAENVDEGETPKDSISGDKITHFQPPIDQIPNLDWVVSSS
jgi:hypothetical protein